MTGVSAWVEVPFAVQKPLDGLRADRFLAARLHRYSRSQVQRLIAAGRVSLDGRPVKAATRLAAGRTVLIRYPRHEELPCPHEELPILHEDERLLVVDKPAPLLCHPTDRVHNNTATSILKRQFPGRRLHLVHRLDRETSGALLLAKDAAAARFLAGCFTARRVRKEYLALAWGRPAWRREVVDVPLGRELGEIKVRQRSGTGVCAVTEFELLAAGAGLCLVLARPKTGRLHQIRVHLAHLGHPVLGDKLYTGSGELYLKAVRKTLTEADLQRLGASRQMLHARRLVFPHPDGGREFSVACPPPADFRAALSEAGIPWS
ncbi:MAG: RluA family pseudouridine synthase [Elusimicrobia bacterium]|nr:RluA family pseudouridine synthase [Elusimicrobiota bacterium]